MTVTQLLALLSSGKEAQFTIRFIEGSKLSDWSAILRDAPYLTHETEGKSLEQLSELLAIETPDSLEGWFYP
ncbi:putative aminodeoxychorismate lyase [Moellerella wisconsensis]|nr:putative aminodeoxychorismate lyase [Moellerella wisconsensis]